MKMSICFTLEQKGDQDRALDSKNETLSIRRSLEIAKAGEFCLLRHHDWLGIVVGDLQDSDRKDLHCWWRNEQEWDWERKGKMNRIMIRGFFWISAYRMDIFVVLWKEHRKEWGEVKDWMMDEPIEFCEILERKRSSFGVFQHWYRHNKCSIELSSR